MTKGRGREGVLGGSCSRKGRAPRSMIKALVAQVVRATSTDPRNGRIQVRNCTRRFVSCLAPNQYQTDEHTAIRTDDPPYNGMVYQNETDPPRAQSAPQTKEAMSTKLNAEELAAKIDTDALNDSRAIGYVGTYDIQAYRLGASVAIEKIAQPIADERDELREALSDEVGRMANLIRAIDMLKDSPVSLHGVLMKGVEEARQRLTNYRAILAKYTKP